LAAIYPRDDEFDFSLMALGTGRMTRDGAANS